MDTQLEELTARLGRMEQELHQTRGDLSQTRGDLIRATRRARVTGSLALAALVGTALIGTRPAVFAQAPGVTLASLLTRIVALEAKTAPLSLQTDAGRADGRKNTELYLTGVNVHVVSGSGSTYDGTLDQNLNPVPNTALLGLGNVILGYNQSRSTITSVDLGPDVRTGSHNLIVGDFNNYSSFGGQVVGFVNTISGLYASVSGGSENTSSGSLSSATGGAKNTASGYAASVSGGIFNTSSGNYASVSGGNTNTARIQETSVSGGYKNVASGRDAVVGGGSANTASGDYASVGGGAGLTANGGYTYDPATSRFDVWDGAGPTWAGSQTLSSGGPQVSGH